MLFPAPLCPKAPDRGGKTLSFILHLTNDCNLSCKYCYSVRNKERMSLAVAAKALKMAYSLSFKKIMIVFFGGEPLLEWGLLKQVVRISRVYSKDTEYILSTNALLLDEEKLDFIQRTGIKLQLSIDGPPAVQDASRVDLARRGTSGLVSRVLPLVKKRGAALRAHLRLTATPETAGRLSECVDYFIRQGLGDRIIYVDLEVVSSRWKERDIRLFSTELAKIEKTIIRRRRAGKKLDIRFYADYSVFRFRGITPSRKFCCCGGRDRLAVTPGGDIYPCYVFACSPEKYKHTLIGNVSQRGLDPVQDRSCTVRAGYSALDCPFSPMQTAGVASVTLGKRTGGEVRWEVMKCDIGENCSDCSSYADVLRVLAC